MTHEEHRALVEAGYAPPQAYVLPTYTVEKSEYQHFHRRFVVEIVAQTRFGVEYGCDLYKCTDASWAFHNPFTLADGTWMIRGEKEDDHGNADPQ